MSIIYVDMTNFNKGMKVRGNLVLFKEGCLATKNIIVLKLEEEKSRNGKFFLPTG